LDTKWRKLRIIVSFTAFFVGMTLLLGNFLSMLSLIGSSPDSFKSRMGTDYQEQADFRMYMSSRLEELLGVATGGKGWNNYGVTYAGDSYYFYDGYYGNGWWGYPWETTTEVQEAERVYLDEIAEEEADASEDTWDEIQREYGIADDTWDAIRREYDISDYSRPRDQKEALEAYMKEYARDKNLRYAVIYQGKLLYTNMEQLEPRIGAELNNPDFQSCLPAEEEYNFCLWYNEKGDGKVRISKDGEELDVYGDGVYTEDSLWYVPGYTNFNVDESAKDAVIFMAAARNPKLYITGDYSEYGAVCNRGGLYWMQKNQAYRYERYQAVKWQLIAALFLLTLAVLLRKDKRLADGAIGRFLGHIWLEPKVLLFVGIPIGFLLIGGREILQELIWIYEDGIYMNMEELGYYAGRFVARGSFLTAAFWMIYLGVVDLRTNKGNRKSLLGPVIRSMRTKELKLSVQKRMVERYCQVFVLAVLFCVFAVFAAVLYCSTYYLTAQILVLLLFAVFFGICFLLVGVWNLRRNKELAQDLGALSDQIAAVREGNLTERLALPEDADLKTAAENLNEIQQGMEMALREQTKSERMKVELVANVSHDIKTPLTSIVSYVELLKQEEDLPEHVKEYVQILGEKSERLKTMVQDVFEISKAASNQLPVNLERLDLGKLLWQTLADMNVQISESGLAMKTVIPETPVMILADGQRLYRVFQNLIQNALKYSLSGSRIFLTLTDNGSVAVASIKNTSGVEIDDEVDFTERFVRGDASRTDGGSGLGLSIAKSFTEACGGSFQVELNADLFTVTVEFPKIS
jgi:signal transduction histidine kinase/plasmid maintenance system antidote protein VapI